ncbi:MAG: FAD-binding oxidoreductase, partial [Oscillospiraceae bacterium]|nr:FAD-binding oxidoreductase [Oscillospiraceae bacterium]
MSKPYKGYEPQWFQGEIPSKSYRSVFKWGAPEKIKAPREGLFRDILGRFGIDEAQFESYTQDLGLDEVKFDLPLKLTAAQLDALRAIVGADFVRTDDYARFSVAYGKTMYDLLRARNKIIENVPDAVLYPDTKEIGR